jgi:vitamin B12 transporter
LKKPTRFARIAPIFALAFSLPTLAAGQQSFYQQQQPKKVFRNEITVTATGIESDTDEVPAPTTIITRQDMDDAQVENVADLLRRVPGVAVMRSGNEGKVTSVFTRGTESDHTLVLFDGVRLNSPYFGGYDWSTLNTAGLERVEVARGPYSALWGADAIGGVVNVIPKHGTGGFDFDLFAEGGEQGWQRYEGDLSFGGEKFNIYASGLYKKGDGELENDDFKTEQGLVDVGWRWESGSRIAVVYQNVETETGIPFINPELPSPDRRQQAEQELIAVPLRFSIVDSWSLELVGSKVERVFRFSDPDDPFLLTDTETQADTTQMRLASHHTLGDHTLSWGAEWREDEVTDLSNFGLNLDGAASETTSGFVQSVLSAGNRLRMIAGVRWDDTDEWGSEVSPRIHIGWDLSPTVTLRAGYGTAFRAPSLGELYFPFSGNPELEPEESKSLELDLVYVPVSKRSRWQLNYFSTDLENLIQFDFATYTNQNIATAEIRGLELVIESELTDVSHQLLQITYLKTEDDNGMALLRRPDWTGSYTLGGLLLKSLRGDVTVLYMGPREDVNPVTFEREQMGGFFTYQLSLAWTLSESFELTGRAINLTDKEYQEVLGYPAPSRRFMIGLRLHL